LRTELLSGRLASAAGVPQGPDPPAGQVGESCGPIAEIEIAEEPAQAREDKNMLAGRATRC
jgi:hypothetical protein